MAKTYVVALDAGHGLRTAGKQTPDGIKEWTLNDKVRDKVVALLQGYNVRFIFPDNNEGNNDEALSGRKSMYLNQKVDAAVSIHHNAYNGKWNKATGVEVYTDKNPTQKDLLLATYIYERLVKYTGLKARGVKHENWAVINQNSIPAVLTEGGFMDSTIDYPIITSDAGQDAYARAVAEGLIQFLGLKKTGTTTATPAPAPVQKPATPAPAQKEAKYKLNTLKKGSRGNDVTIFESIMKKMGLYKGAIDTSFGNGCVEACNAFQKKYPECGTNGQPDGVFGPKCWAKALSLLG